MVQKIFLVGFMGAGKTHWGERLAAHTGATFTDTDACIEAETGKTIADLFEIPGESGFRILEQQCLHRLCADPRNLIVATGGGLPCFFDNMAKMRQEGCVIYLKTPIEILSARLLSEKSKRPLLREVEAAALPAAIAERLAGRSAFYEQAHYTAEDNNSRDEAAFLNILSGFISNHPFPA
jgi:shikimate kinase